MNMAKCAICSNNIKNEILKVYDMVMGDKEQFEYIHCSSVVSLTDLYIWQFFS
jgi:hypothetical protein